MARASFKVLEFVAFWFGAPFVLIGAWSLTLSNWSHNKALLIAERQRAQLLGE